MADKHYFWVCVRVSGRGQRLNQDKEGPPSLGQLPSPKPWRAGTEGTGGGGENSLALMSWGTHLLLPLDIRAPVLKPLDGTKLYQWPPWSLAGGHRFWDCSAFMTTWAISCNKSLVHISTYPTGSVSSEALANRVRNCNNH